MAKKYHQAGFTPIVIILLLALIGGSIFVAIRNNVPTQVVPSTAPTVSLAPSSSPSVKPSPVKTPSTLYKSPTPIVSSTPISTSSPTSTTVSTVTSTSVSTPTPTPTPSPTPTPTPAKKTYTWNGTNVNATVSCFIGETTFDVSISGDVPSPTGDNGIWTTLTGDGKTIITSYQGQASTPHIAMNYNDQAGAIRPGGPTTLKASNTSTYGYELNVYYAPYTDGMPSLANSIGNVSFAIDCSK